MHDKPAVRWEFYSQTKQRVCHARRHSRFLKIIASGLCMCSISRTYFRGGLVSMRTSSVPSKYYKKCPAFRVQQKMHLFRSALYTKGILRVYDYGIFFLLPIVIHRADFTTTVQNIRIARFRSRSKNYAAGFGYTVYHE